MPTASVAITTASAFGVDVLLAARRIISDVEATAKRSTGTKTTEKAKEVEGAECTVNAQKATPDRDVRTSIRVRWKTRALTAAHVR
jgi:hypothetical protein